MSLPRAVPLVVTGRTTDDRWRCPDNFSSLSLKTPEGTRASDDVPHGAAKVAPEHHRNLHPRQHPQTHRSPPVDPPGEVAAGREGGAFTQRR